MHDLSNMLDHAVVLESQLETLRNRVATAESKLGSVKKWCANAKSAQVNPAQGVSTYAFHTINAYHSAADEVLKLLEEV